MNSMSALGSMLRSKLLGKDSQWEAKLSGRERTHGKVRDTMAS